MGFTNRTGGPDGPLMYVYERNLRSGFGGSGANVGREVLAGEGRARGD
jgi:hypothetical protein